jgi:hypothetical protein
MASGGLLAVCVRLEEDGPMVVVGGPGGCFGL